MNDRPNMTPEQLSVLLKIVAARTGKDPIHLKEELENGSADGILSALGADRDKLRQLMDNREELEGMLSSPQARALLQQLLGQK